LKNYFNLDILNKIKEDCQKYYVIKFGGSIMNNTDAILDFISDVQLLKEYGIKVIIVHGGGPEINKWLSKTNINGEFINGLRLTKKDTMEVVEMVLCGTVSKKLSSLFSQKNISVVGLSGRDNKLIEVEKMYTLDKDGVKLDLGFVGKVNKVNPKILYDLLSIGITPIISPIGCDNNGDAYNINADYVASAIAGAVKAEKLIILSDIEGVYKDINDKNSLIDAISFDEIKNYIDNGIITGGMIPKLQCCIEALENGSNNVHLIDGRNSHCVVNDTFTGKGTKIQRELI
jgi:acetylglutamate kinase